MTLENPTTNGGSTEYIPAAKITKSEPLTSSYVESESSTRTGSVSDTANGGTGLDKTSVTGVTPPTAESYTQSLLGPKRPWGLDPFDYPPQLKFTALGEFDSEFNTVPDQAQKKTAPKAEETPTGETKPDGTPKEKATAPAAGTDKAKPAVAADPADVIISDPFDPKFNQVVPKNTDAVKPEVPKPADVPKPGDGAGETDGQKPAIAGEKPAEKPGTSSKVIKGVTDAVTGAVEDAAKLPEKAVKDGVDVLSSFGTALGFGTDQEAARITGNAEKGKKHADSQDVQFVKQWRGLANNGEIAPPKEGDDPAKYTHTNADKSSYTVTNGKISDFTTAPTKDHPDGVKYREIKYDAKDQIVSYANGNGQTHTRTGPTDANGFASWKATDTATGKPVNYGESSTWQGKPVVNAEGFHNLIRSGKYAGQMFSRHMDGSQVSTKPEYAHGTMTGLETTTTLPDGTKVSQKGHFDSKTHKLEHKDTVTVKEADGPKMSQVKFDGMKFNGIEKGSLVPPPQPEKSAAGDGMIGMFKDILSPEALNKMKDIKEMNIQRIGPHSFHIDGNMNNVFMEPPNVTVGGFGPLGRVAATPQGGYLNKFDLNMHIGDNRVDIDGVHGVHGTASLARHKRNGKVKGIGSTGTTTTGATWDMNRNVLTARSASGPPTPLDARNFAKGSFTGNLLSDENAEKNAKAMLNGLDKNLDGASLKQIKPGVFDVSIDLKANQIPIDAKIPNVKANIYLDDKVNFTRSAEGATFKPGEAQLGVQVGKGLEQRKDIAKLSSGTNEKGEPVMKIEFHGKHDPMTIPLGKPDAAKPGEVKKPAAAKPETVQPARPEATPPAVKVEPKPEVQKPDAKIAPTGDTQTAPRVEREVTPRRPESNTTQRPANNNNHCNEGSHRRRIFFGRRGR